MRQYNAENERIKRKYFIFLKEAKRQDESSIDVVAKALNRFENYTQFKDFKMFKYQQAIGFKKHFTQQNNIKTRKPLSKSTVHTTLNHLKKFFEWLSQQSGFKSRLIYTDMEYFNLSGKDTRIAKAKRTKPVPTIEQIEYVIKNIPYETVIEKRDRALIAFTLLTGARDRATASMKLKHIDLASNSIFQDANEVETKFSKTFKTYFFPVGYEVTDIVKDWVNYLKKELNYGYEDPLFPKTEVKSNTQKIFAATGITKEHWSNATPIRRIFKKSFESCGLPYFNPHSFRNTLVKLGQSVCNTPEHFKAWSQNLGHEGVLTTFYSYGEVSQERQSEILCNINSSKESESIEKKMTELINNLSSKFLPDQGF